jgi:hypothetical protein
VSLFGSKRRLSSALLVSSAVLFGGCSLDVAMYTTGRLQVVVLDTSENPVPNIRADLLLDDKLTVWKTATTGADGRAEFDPGAGGVLIQGYFVRLILSPDWNMAPGEPNDKPVIPSGGSVVVVRYHIQKVATP